MGMLFYFETKTEEDSSGRLLLVPVAHRQLGGGHRFPISRGCLGRYPIKVSRHSSKNIFFPKTTSSTTVPAVGSKNAVNYENKNSSYNFFLLALVL